MEELTHLKRPWCWERSKAGKGMTEDEVVRQHHQFNGHEYEQTPGDSERQESMACCSPYDHKGLWHELVTRHELVTEQQKKISSTLNKGREPNLKIFSNSSLNKYSTRGLCHIRCYSLYIFSTLSSTFRKFLSCIIQIHCHVNHYDISFFGKGSNLGIICLSWRLMADKIWRGCSTSLIITVSHSFLLNKYLWRWLYANTA